MTDFWKQLDAWWNLWSVCLHVRTCACTHTHWERRGRVKRVKLESLGDSWEGRIPPCPCSHLSPKPTMPLFTPESSRPDSTPRPVVKRWSPITECAPCGRRYGDVELWLYHCSKIFEISYFKTLNSIIRVSNWTCLRRRWWLRCRQTSSYVEKEDHYPSNTHPSCCPQPCIHRAKILFLNEDDHVSC